MMRLWLARHWIPVLLCATFASLVIRVGWHASRAETGWELLWERTWQSCNDFRGISKPPLADQDPLEQARFWVNEIGQNPPQTAEAAAGAAWMLDGPQLGFVVRHARVDPLMRSFTGLSSVGGTVLNHDSIDVVLNEFEIVAGPECLQQIERATQLEPANVVWWRLRAMLQFHIQSLYSLDLNPRRAEWRTVLAQCAEHDPENALYDYLAADACWLEATQISYVGGDPKLTVIKPIVFEESQRRFDAGQAKPRLQFGPGLAFVTWPFAEEISLTKFAQVLAAASRQNQDRGNLLRRLQRRQSVLLHVVRRESDTERALQILREVHHVAEQQKEYNYYDAFLTIWSLANIQELADENEGLLTVDERQSVDKELSDARLTTAAYVEADKQWKLRNPPKPVPRNATASFELTYALFLLLAAAIAWGVSWLVDRSCPPPLRMGFWRNCAAWLVTLLFSFCLLGLVPAEIVPPTAQTWIVRQPLWAAMSVLFIGPAVWLWRKFRVPLWHLLGVSATTLAAAILIGAAYFDYGQTMVDFVVQGFASLSLPAILAWIAALTALVCTLLVLDIDFLWRSRLTALQRLLLINGLAAAAGIAVFIAATVESALQQHTGPWIPARVWEEIRNSQLSAEDLRDALPATGRDWLWALVQWFAWSGPQATAVGAALLVGLWWFLRRTLSHKGQITWKARRQALSGAGRAAARSLLGVATLLLTIDLALVPTTIDQLEAVFQEQRKYLEDPSAGQRELTEAVRQVRSDPAAMLRIRQELQRRK